MSTHYYPLNSHSNQQQFHRGAEREYSSTKAHELEPSRVQAKREAIKQKIKARFDAVKSIFLIQYAGSLESQPVAINIEN